MEIVACPLNSELVQLLLGEITGDAADTLNGHVKNCIRCIENFQALKQVYGPSASPEQKPRVSESSSEKAANKKLRFLAPAMGSDELGRLGHYRVLKMLGEGGMGMVLLAEDTHLERHVALKVIKDEYREDEEVQERFMREARSMAQVRSDHVVTVHQVGRHENVCFIAMELLEGGPLERLVESPTRPSLNEILRIGRELAQALAAFHCRGLVHRDIKPENVWLEAPSGRVKLLDFGLARPRQANVKLTASGMIMGTPAYMAPEQARAEHVDERTDLFSLGCVLYALLTGRSPFHRTTIMDTLLALATETPPPPSAFDPLCPKALDNLVLKLIEKEPSQRPASAQAVLEQFEIIEREMPEMSGAAADHSIPPTSLLRTGQDSLLQSKAPFATTKAAPVEEEKKTERRQVTVLVCGCDLFESEEYLESLDSTARKGIFDYFDRTCREAISHLNGTIVQCGRDSFIACFGYPVADEDAAQLASGAALAIFESLSSLAEMVERDHNLQLGSWLTLHTGPAIVGSTGGTISLVGEARNVALRLRDFAAGQIVLSESTHRVLRGNFTCQSVGVQKIKGLNEPIELYQLQMPLDASSFLAKSGSVELSPLTGRDLEISLLLNRWQQAQEGMGQVVLLVGEAGLGKSRLVHTMKDHVACLSKTGEDSPVIEWRCSPHFRNSGLYPASNFFQRLLSFRRDEPQSDQFERLLKHLERYGLATQQLVPLFATLLSLPTDGRFPSRSLTPSREREELFLALKDWLRAYSERQPVLFVIEDLHWLDASTLEFLGQLVTEVQHDRILILLTFRPEFHTPWPVLAHQTSLALTRLNKQQVFEMMQTKIGQQVPEGVCSEVFDRSGGVPLFVEEFTKMVRDSGILAQAGESGTRIKTLMARAIPATLQDLIMSRLDRMEGDRELAQLASALGRGFSFELIAAVSGQNSQALESELAKLVQAEILYQKGRAPQSTYVFKHALLEDALYNAMVKGHRQQCHARIADALERQFAKTTETQPEFIAHHFTEAELPERAIPYWLAAGLRAQEQFANVEAINHFTKGLDATNKLALSSERDLHELSLLCPLSSSFQMSDGYSAPQVGPAFIRARELCEKVGTNTQLFEIMWGSWVWHLVRANLDLCMQLSEEMIAFAGRLKSDAMSMEAHVALGVNYYYRGDFKNCHAQCQKAITEFENLDKCTEWAAKLGQNAAIVSRCYRAASLWLLGFPEQGLKEIEDAVNLARQIGHPFSLAHALYFASRVNLFARLAAPLKRFATELKQLSVDQGFALWIATADFHIGAAELLDGNIDESITYIERGVQGFKALNAVLTLPVQLAVLSKAYMKAARFDDAQRVLAEAFSQSEASGDHVFLAELRRIKGEFLLATTNNQAAAEELFKEAIEIAQLQNSKGWELRATTSLARLVAQQGRADDARTLLSRACGWFKEGQALPDLADARALLSTFS